MTANHESAKDFVTKMGAGAFQGKLSGELSRLSREELAEIERILIDRLKSSPSKADGSPAALSTRLPR